jgi:hypothetical protein
MAARGRTVAVAAAAAAVVVVGGGLALHGVTENGSPAATTVQSSSTVPTSLPATTTTPTPSPSAGTVVIAPTGPDLPGSSVLAVCRSNSSWTVDRYETAALGSVVMQCGNSSQGYRHIEIRHEQDWKDDLRGLGGRDWDDLMLTAVDTALTSPGHGFPVDAGDGKVCYAAPIRFADGRTPADGWVKVIVSATTERVITAYPTTRSDC